MSKPLNIGTANGNLFDLPLEMITQSVAILAKKRVGKSYTAAVLAEEMMAAGQQVVIIDPTGAHWGMRSSADGKSAGFPIVVFGGDHADLPLEDSAGEVLAQAIIAQRFSAIIDTSIMRKGQMVRFLTTFCEALYRLNRAPLCLICDEADAYAPQKPQAEEARMLGAMEDLVRRGGLRGIGTYLITQRPAVINKNVLTQCEVLIALRLVHPIDIKTLMEWVNVHADPGTAKQMTESLPNLPIGTCWFWAPGMDIFAKVKIRLRTTFDSGATPKPGEARKTPKVLAEIDVAKLGAQIESMAQRSKEDDPRALRLQIADLRRQLEQRAPSPADITELDSERRQRLALAGDAMALLQAIAPVEAAAAELRRASSALHGRVAAAAIIVQANPHLMHTGGVVIPAAVVRALGSARRPLPPIDAKVRTASARVDKALTGGMLAVLTACAQTTGGCTLEQLSVLTGYKRSSRDTYLQKLTAQGLVDKRDGMVFATDHGFKALPPDWEPLPTGGALAAYWRNRLGEGERRILDTVMATYPNSISRDLIDQQTGYKRSSRDTYLQKLKARRLVRDMSGGIVAAVELFD